MADYETQADGLQAQAENEMFNVGEKRKRIRNMLKRAANYIQTRSEECMSETVVYKRPGVGQVTVQAIVGGTDYSQDDGMGLIIRIIRNDYTIRQSALVIDGVRIVPQRNDIILQTLDNGDVYEGRVLGEGPVPHYQDADGYGVAWRIHTKRDEVR